tara:strand:+ start:31055 stop:31843 length:789 start_codon:yes stop_codon:yes gene_type:complete
MKFFTNKISTNSNGRFSDLVKKIAESDQQVKTASAKTAEENVEDVVSQEENAKVEAKSDTKVVKAEAGVDDDGEGKRTDVHHGEGSPKDQNGEPEEDGENKTVDPEGLGSSAEAEEEVKIASEEGESGSKLGNGEGDSGDNQEGVNKGRFPDEFEPKQECEDEGTADVEASGEKQVKEAGELPEALKEHQFGKKDSEDKKDSEGNDDADGKDDDAEKEGCSASATSKLERVANLTAPEKNRLKSYFRRYYPESYADALTQDK